MIIHCTRHAKLRAESRLGIKENEFLGFVKDELSDCLVSDYNGTKRVITKSDAYFILDIIDENNFLLKTVYEHPHYSLNNDKQFGQKCYKCKVVWDNRGDMK